MPWKSLVLLCSTGVVQNTCNKKILNVVLVVKKICGKVWEDSTVFMVAQMYFVYFVGAEL
jgi:hypothetical protein